MDRDADPRADTLMPADSGQEDFSLAEMDPDAAAAIKAIVTNPSLTAADVPGVRIELANDAGVAEIAVETAHSIGARNSVERMLAHQMALAHRSAFLLGRQLEAALPKASTDDNANLRATRLATAMSRVLGSYQGTYGAGFEWRSRCGACRRSCLGGASGGGSRVQGRPGARGRTEALQHRLANRCPASDGARIPCRLLIPQPPRGLV